MPGKATKSTAKFTTGRVDTTYEHRGGTNYDVGGGDVWQAGPHVVANLDITTGTFHRWFERQEKPKAVFVDPPWGDSMVKQYYAKAGHKSAPVFTAIVQAVAQVCQMSRCPALIETGNRQLSHILQGVQANGGVHLGTVPIVYYKKNPCSLVVASFDGGIYPVPENAEGHDDEEVPRIALASLLEAGTIQPGDLVYDPCCGRGLTARGAIQNGLRFLGTELSPFRMSGTLTEINRLTGHVPARIGSQL